MKNIWGVLYFYSRTHICRDIGKKPDFRELKRATENEAQGLGNGNFKGLFLAPKSTFSMKIFFPTPKMHRWILFLLDYMIILIKFIKIVILKYCLIAYIKIMVFCLKLFSFLSTTFFGWGKGVEEDVQRGSKFRYSPLAGVFAITRHAAADLLYTLGEICGPLRKFYAAILLKFMDMCTSFICSPYRH